MNKALIAGLVIVLGGAVVIYRILNTDEMNSKQEWSVLQSLEYKFRGAEKENDLLLKNGDGTNQKYFAAGFKTVNSNDRVWILLNPKWNPLLKKMSSQSGGSDVNSLEYVISKDELIYISEKTEIDRTVLRDLLLHLKCLENGKSIVTKGK